MGGVCASSCWRCSCSYSRKRLRKSGAHGQSGAIFVLVIRSYGTRNPGISGLSRERTVNRSGTRVTEFFFNKKEGCGARKKRCVVGKGSRVLLISSAPAARARGPPQRATAHTLTCVDASAALAVLRRFRRYADRRWWIICEQVLLDSGVLCIGSESR